MSTLLLAGGVGPDGARLDVRCAAATGRIAEAAPELPPRPGDEVVGCAGMVLLPAAAEPHAHLDKALSADLAPNPRGDLAGAIDAWHAHWPSLTEDAVLRRARAAAHELVAHGVTAIRSHVDIGPGIGLTGVRALVRLRDELREERLADLQLCALVAPPLTGPDGAGQRALLRDALELGVEVVGGCPHLEPRPRAAAAIALGVAAEHGRPIDLHTDETLDGSSHGLADLAALVATTGFDHGATASHCVALGVQPAEVQRRVAAAVAAAGVAVVTLPQTNLFLQARGIDQAPPRGLTAVRALLDAGVTLAAGADNLRDPFCSVGRADPLETAALLVMAAHLSPAEAWAAVAGGARRALGLEPGGLAPGDPAELLAVRGTSLVDAIARASEHRTVVHRGRVVARTAVTGALEPAPVPVPLLT